MQRINRITFTCFLKIWGRNKIPLTEEAWIKYCLHYFTLYKIDISAKSDFQKELLLLKTLSQALKSFHQVIFKWGTQVRDFISGKTNKQTYIKIKNMTFYSNISYLARSTSSPSVKSIMLAMQYLKGTLYCNLPLSLPLHFPTFLNCADWLWSEHLRKEGRKLRQKTI